MIQEAVVKGVSTRKIEAVLELGLAFYDGKMFPAEYSGDVFAAEHGSWNHSQGSGREVIRIPIETLSRRSHFLLSFVI